MLQWITLTFIAEGLDEEPLAVLALLNRDDRSEALAPRRADRAVLRAAAAVVGAAWGAVGGAVTDLARQEGRDYETAGELLYRIRSQRDAEPPRRRARMG